MQADVVIDARGHKCPWGIVEMKKRFRTMAGGQVIQLQSDDQVSAP
ncbi:MAG: sulfurtransferase TusA family protein [Anaerolineae bacterium]